MNAPFTLGGLGTDGSGFVAKDREHFIDGQWPGAADGKIIDVIDPATEMAWGRAKGRHAIEFHGR